MYCLITIYTTAMNRFQPHYIQGTLCSALALNVGIECKSWGAWEVVPYGRNSYWATVRNLLHEEITSHHWACVDSCIDQKLKRVCSVIHAETKHWKLSQHCNTSCPLVCFSRNKNVVWASVTKVCLFISFCLYITNSFQLRENPSKKSWSLRKVCWEIDLLQLS